MATTPYTIEQFGGLNAIDDPFDVGASAAVDLANVDLDARGRVRCRDGYTRIVAVSNTDARGLLAAYESTTVLGDGQLLVGYFSGITPVLSAYTLAGALIATLNPASFPLSSAAYGTTGATQYLYLANGFGDTIRRWDGTAFSSPGGMPKAVFLASTVKSGRLVAASTSTSTYSRVEFSDPFNAESWDASNFVDLNPGEGFFAGMVVWRDMLFVFKQRQFFVFQGEGVDADGGVIFNYRVIDRYGGFEAIAGNEGVYFWDGRSVWLTTGDTPVRVSTPVEPVLRGEVAINGETVNATLTATHRMSYSNGRLFVSMLMDGGAYRTLVFDPQLSTWTYWTIGVNVAVDCGGALGVGPRRTFWLSTAGIEVFDGATADPAGAIAWSYTSGKYPLSDPTRAVITQESTMTGTGTATLNIDTDLYTGVSDAVTMGTSPAVAEGWLQKDQEGTWFQHTISGTGPATVARLAHFGRFVRPADVR